MFKFLEKPFMGYIYGIIYLLIFFGMAWAASQ
jgi:hypothetical protein